MLVLQLMQWVILFCKYVGDRYVSKLVHTKVKNKFDRLGTNFTYGSNVGSPAASVGDAVGRRVLCVE